MQIIVPDIVWSIINFLVLVAILNKFLYKPILGMLDARKTEIQSKYQQADEARNEALKVKEEYLKEMQNAKREAQEIITKAGKLGEDTKEEIIAEARENATKVSKKALEEIRLERDKAKAELRDEVAALAVLAAGKILDKTIQPEDHAKMIQEFVSEVGGAS